MTGCFAICIFGRVWAPDPDRPSSCPEEEMCCYPTTPGQAGEKWEGPCVPLGTC